MINNLIQKYKLKPAQLIQQSWEHLTKLPKGNVLFSKLLGQYIPYAGSISPLVQELSKGHAIVYMRDKRGIRNHHEAIHAVAIANLGEFVTSLTIISQIKDNEKAAIVKLDVEYLKKAKGDLTAEASFIRPETVNPEMKFNISSQSHFLLFSLLFILKYTLLMALYN